MVAMVGEFLLASGSRGGLARIPGRAGIDANDPDLVARIRSLQLLRMLELLADGSLGAAVRRTVANRLHTVLRRPAA